MDMVIRLATTINAYEDVAFTSKSTNMGTYVYEKLDAIPEEFRPRLMDELSVVGLVNCWYIAGLLYKVKFQEREAGGALDISSDLEDYQERLDATVEQAAASGGADFSLDESVDDDDYADDEEGRAAKARRAAALVASAAGVQVFEGRAANVPGGPFVNRFQKVFYPSPKDVGVWLGRVVLKKLGYVEKYVPLYFRTNDTVERFVKSPRRRRTRTCCSITRTPRTWSRTCRRRCGTRAGGRRARARVPCGGRSPSSRYPRSTRWWITSGLWDPGCTREGGGGTEDAGTSS